MEKWYQHSFRRNLVDMHISDSDPFYMSQYDPIQYVNNLITAHIDTAILYAGNCLGICFWPTKVGHMHSSLQGRDILHEVITECRKHNLGVIVYFNIWSRWAYDTYPEWRCRDEHGKGLFVERDGNRFGMCCSNTGYANYVHEQVQDLVSNYDMDGLWIDMIGWFGGVCCCESCRSRYLRDTGHLFPERVDWRDPAWRTFQEHREKWLAEFAGMIRQSALTCKSDISVTFNTANMWTGKFGGISDAFMCQIDYPAGDFYGDPAEQSFICKTLESLANHKPVEFMTSLCPTLDEHTTRKPKELLEAQVYASLANNAAFTFIDAMDPAGTVNPSIYQTMGEIFLTSSEYEKYLGVGLVRQADIAIFVDLNSLADMQDNGKVVGAYIHTEPNLPLQNIAKTLISNNIPYDVVTAHNLDCLKNYQVVILSDMFMLKLREADALRRYVELGGMLYASKNTSLVHGNGDFLLSDVFGVTYKGETTECITYIAPTGRFDGFAPFTAAYPMALTAVQTLVEAAPDAEILATVTLPFTPPNDPYIYSSAISNPPGKPTISPAIVRHTFGQGQCIYIAGRLEAMKFDAQSVIFARLLRSLMTQSPRFITNAPKPVEVIVYDDTKSKRFIVSVLNFQDKLPNIPVYNMKIAINLQGKTLNTIMELPFEKPISWIFEVNYVRFTVEKVETFMMFAINYK